MGADITEPVGPGGAAPAVVTPPPAAAPKPPQHRVVGATTGTPITVTPPVEAGEEDDDSDDAAPVVAPDGKQIPAKPLEDRLARQKRQVLREEYGTSDPEKIKAIRAERAAKLQAAEEREKEYERLRRQEDARKRARLSTEQKLAADLKAKDDQIAALRAEVEQAKTMSVVDRQDRQIGTIALKYLDPGSVDYAKYQFSKYVKALPQEKQQRLNDIRIERWFEKFSKENPKFARVAPETQAPAPAVPAPKPPVRRAPVSHGRPVAPPRPATAHPDQPGVYNGKTVKPGPNAMTRAEYREFKKSRGYSA